MRLVQVISDYIRRSILTTQGDMVVRGAAQPQRLASGGAGSYLMGQGAGVIPAYDTPPIMPACRANRSANQAIPSGAWTKIELDRTDYDSTGDFDAVNHMYICSQAGIYLVAVNIAVYLPTIVCIGGVRINRDGVLSSPYQRLYMGIGGTAVFCATDILELAVNEELELYGYHTSGVARSIRGGVRYFTYMSIHRLS